MSIELCHVNQKQRIMNTSSTTLRIESIFFNNMDTKVHIKGEIIKNHLSYNSEMFISFSELNSLLNVLQQQNPTVDINELVVEDELNSGFSQTELNVGMLENTVVLFSKVQFSEDRKMICA